MKAANLQTSGVEALSKEDLRLKRYIELNEEIKALTKEFDQIKEEIKHRGSFSTHNFVAIVKDQSRTYPPSLEVLVEVYGDDVRKLCKVTHLKTVSVSRKD